MNTSQPSALAPASATPPAPVPAPAYRFLPFGRVSGSTLLWSVLTGMALVVPLLCLIHLLPLSTARTAGSLANSARLAQMPAGLLALQAVVLFPLLEECFYRGLILQLLRRYLPLWIALMPPTLLFGFTHLGTSPQNAVFALLLGFYFGWLSVAGRSLLPSIFCHAGVNLLVRFGLYRLPGWGEPAADGSFFPPLVIGLLVFSLAILAVGVRQLRREFRRVAAVTA